MIDQHQEQLDSESRERGKRARADIEVDQILINN